MDDTITKFKIDSITFADKIWWHHRSDQKPPLDCSSLHDPGGIFCVISKRDQEKK